MERQPDDEPRAVDVLDLDRSATPPHLLADEREPEAALALPVARDLRREAVAEDLIRQRGVDARARVVNCDPEFAALHVQRHADVTAAVAAPPRLRRLVGRARYH